LEYHLRMLTPPVQIGIIAGKQKDPVKDYLEKHERFGHERHNFCWIPERYRTPEMVNKPAPMQLPDFPYASFAGIFSARNLCGKPQSG